MHTPDEFPEALKALLIRIFRFKKMIMQVIVTKNHSQHRDVEKFSHSKTTRIRCHQVSKVKSLFTNVKL